MASKVKGFTVINTYVELSEVVKYAYPLTCVGPGDQLASGPDDDVLGFPVTGRGDGAPPLLHIAALVVAVLAEVEDGALVAGDPSSRQARGLSVCDAAEESDEEDELHLRTPLEKFPQI